MEAAKKQGEWSGDGLACPSIIGKSFSKLSPSLHEHKKRPQKGPFGLASGA
jgi:hypothetical protein